MSVEFLEPVRKSLLDRNSAGSQRSSLIPTDFDRSLHPPTVSPYAIIESLSNQMPLSFLFE